MVFGIEADRTGLASRLAASVAVLTLVAVGQVVNVVATAPPTVAQVSTVAPLPNPAVDEQCGLPVTLVLDASGSIENFGAVEKVRGAARVFLDALKNTGS